MIHSLGNRQTSMDTDDHTAGVAAGIGAEIAPPQTLDTDGWQPDH